MGDSCLIYGIYARAARKRDWRLWTFLLFRKKCEKESFYYFSLGKIAHLKADFCIYLYYTKKVEIEVKKRVAGVDVIYEEGVSNVWKRIPRR